MEQALAETPEAPPGPVTYSYRPSLLGAPRVFTLTDTGIEWSAGPKKGHVPYADVRVVRIGYRPVNMQSYRFTTEIWSAGTPRLQIVSTSFRSLVEHERRDADYNGFVLALHRRLAAAQSTARFVRGINPVLYGVGVIAIGGIVIGMMWLVLRAALVREWAGAAFVAGFLALFAWQGATFLLRNRPGRYKPEAPPAIAMPVPKAAAKA